MGLLPSVQKKAINASMPQVRPPLAEAASLKELGPAGSIIVNDISAALLEVASQPPRLRQDYALFQKEINRYEKAIEPLPFWLVEAMKWTTEDRLNRALAWARVLNLARIGADGNLLRLRLTPEGQQWLSVGAPENALQIFERLRSPKAEYELADWRLGLRGAVSPWGFVPPPSDMVFLGTHIISQQLVTGKFRTSRWQTTPEDYHALRAQLDSSLTALKPGSFYRLENVISHLVYYENNPLNLGLPAEQVAVYERDRLISRDRPEREALARTLLGVFILERLIPFGGVRSAIDDDGKICIARDPRLEGFFGREITRSAAEVDIFAGAKVVVQPDFSVVIIGANAAVAAALVPFCERATRGAGQGAIVLKLTRESVMRAVENRLKPQEIVARLEHHATNGVPANVFRQVREWSNWIRIVNCSSLIAVHCPDCEAADRVMAAMKRHAHRASETLVAIEREKLSTADLLKLREHGIIVDGQLVNREK